MTNQTVLETARNWMRNSIGLKMLILGCLYLILLIPSSMVQSVIRERQGRRNEATREVSGKWAGEQEIAGPMVIIPYLEYFKDEGDQVHERTRYANFLPDRLDIDGRIESEIRYRGIYDVAVFTAHLEISGSFDEFSFEDWRIPRENVLWDEAILSFRIRDMRGIEEIPTFTWNDSLITAKPGALKREGGSGGIHLSVPLVAGESKTQGGRFLATLAIRGSESIRFLPLGEVTESTLTADWGDPSFVGAFLPDRREIQDDSFTAEWKVLAMNRAYPQSWIGDLDRMDRSGFGVQLLLPIDEYLKSTRATKYAGLFIVLTFLAVFLIETVTRKRVHPFQYLLIGSALIVFYLLLLSLGEHVPFGTAYPVASIPVVYLVAAYGRAILQSRRAAVLIGGIMAVLYATLFVLLQVEDHALLVGSTGLFCAIAATMYLTRKIDWYRVEDRRAE